MKPVRHLVVCCAALAIAPAWADATIYRCHALDGALVFQDKPCSQVASTLEAQTGRDGELMPPAPPPAEDGSAARERYERLLDGADQDRRAQAAADEAEAKRLQAQRAADQAAEASRARPANCAGYGPSGDCLDAFYPPYVGYPYVPPPLAASPPRRPSPILPAKSAVRERKSAADAAADATRAITAIH